MDHQLHDRQAAGSEAGKTLIQHPVPSALEHLRAVFSPHCSSLSTPTTAHLKTPPSSSWSLQMTPHWSASSRTETSLLTDKRLRSWLSGAVLTTWSWTRSKQWRLYWTSGEPPPPPTHTIMNMGHSDSWAPPALGTWSGTITLSPLWKAQQRLYFLLQLKKFNLPQELLKQFYSTIIESVLCTSITVWFSSATEGSPDCWANRWYKPPPTHSPRTVLIQSEQKSCQNHSGPSHPAQSLFKLFLCLVDATELWAPERPDTETFFPQAIISWTLNILRGTIIQLLIHHTYLFINFKYAHVRPHT